jgi:type II secretory pathway pseudopilin PulG
MKTKNTSTRRSGYSLIEVLVATGVITGAVAAAVSLGFATISQEEAGNNMARALCVQESAARLFRMGLSGDEIKRLLPKDPIVFDLAITEGTAIVGGSGTLETATITIEFDPTPYADNWSAGTWTGGPGGSASRRTETITAMRPTVKSGAY